MSKEEAIKYLQQLYPNGGHCWLDEQRIEAIGMAVKALQEEPVSDDLKKAAKQYSFYIPTQCEATETWKKETEQHFVDGAKWQLAKNKSITLDNLGEFINELSKQFPEVSFAKVCKIATRTAKWQKKQMMVKAINTKASLIMSVPSICISLPLGVNVGDKVKVIVIKEK